MSGYISTQCVNPEPKDAEMNEMIVFLLPSGKRNCIVAQRSTPFVRSSSDDFDGDWTTTLQIVMRMASNGGVNDVQSLVNTGGDVFAEGKGVGFAPEGEGGR
jgi:hypothetical protein